MAFFRNSEVDERREKRREVRKKLRELKKKRITIEKRIEVSKESAKYYLSQKSRDLAIKALRMKKQLMKELNTIEGRILVMTDELESLKN